MSLRPSETAELRRSGLRLRRVWARGGCGASTSRASRNTALLKRRCAAAGTEAVPHAPPALERMVARNCGLSRDSSSGVFMYQRALPQLAQGLYSDDISTRLEAGRELRKLLSTENPPIQEVISTGVVPCFVHMLDKEDCPELQCEFSPTSSWEHQRTSRWLSITMPCPSSQLTKRGHPLCGPWETFGVSSSFRDIVLAHGALFPLLQLLNGCTKLSILRKATWALGNFCRALPTANFEHVKPALPMLQQLIHSQDEEIISDACWVLIYLSSDSVENIQAVIESGVCPRLVELLTHSSPSVLIAALHVIALPCLLKLLTTNQSKGIKSEVCWTISDIMAGNKDQIQAVINENIIGPLVWLMQTAEFDVKKNAAWAISNATDGGTHDQIKYLISQGCIIAFCNLLGYADTGVLIVCLKGLENILKEVRCISEKCGIAIQIRASGLEIHVTQ
ncbi:hypothetical protein EJB05_30614, partial [Eragrostis curvula]